VKRLAIALSILTLAAGCGGSGKRPAPPDPGRQVLGAFLRAAARGDEAAMRKLLSPQSSRRVSDAQLARLRRRLAPMARRYLVVVSERITGAFGVVAIVSRTSSYAGALRRVGRRWRVEVGGPVRVRALGPDPATRQRQVRQIAAAVTGATGKGYALLWLDGLPLPAKTARLGTSLTLYANLPSRVLRGRHAVVAFANEGNHASALAWTFVVTR
jgi:hypothetical protein